jgi:aminopeptidase-like protein
MDINDFVTTLDLHDIGKEMYGLISRLFPICRSITGNGFRETLDIIKEHIPLNVFEIPTGTQVFDWTVPKEWNIQDAYIKDSRGERIVDFRQSNLHVVSYSVPIKGRVSLAELKKHLFSLPDYPDRIPYRTSYYKEDWGFCLSHKQLLTLRDGDYEVCIDSSLKDGHLTYGECYVQGTAEEEFLISCHVCHPSLCNDNLSGVALAIYLGKILGQLPVRYSYRFLFIPGTIGSITWLAGNEETAFRIKHGLVIVGVGDEGKITYKRSRRGNSVVDRAAEFFLRQSGEPFEIEAFSPYGYDERQFCSPGFNLPVGCFQRTPFGRYAEYHTSADNLQFVKPEKLADSLAKCLSIIHIVDSDITYLNTLPKCEPQLGKRGLYEQVGGDSQSKRLQLAMLWTLNLSDGENSLLEIAERSGLEFEIIKKAAALLSEQSLLEQTSRPKVTVRQSGS